MIPISTNLHLEKITLNDQEDLMAFMHQIYPSPYKHLWKNEDCNWYLDYCFSKESLKQELKEIDAIYCFVVHHLKRIGIVRFQYNTSIDGSTEKNATFIHRIYLSNETQGKGIGKQLFNWIRLQANKKGNKFLWLKAMDTQKQALTFYKKLGFKTIAKVRLDFELIHQELRGMVVMKKSL